MAIVQIPLTKGQIGLIDDIDSDVMSYKWRAQKTFLSKGFYAVRTGPRSPEGRKEIKLHRLILERIVGRKLFPREQCDHINGNTIDNRRCNLRLASSSQNLMNRKLQANNTSGAKGVFWHKRGQRWEVRVGVKGKSIYLGHFADFEEAKRVATEARKQLHGEFSRD